MDFVPTTTKQLATLAQHDTQLRPYFAGVFASHQLPASPIKSRPQGYIVNVDRHDAPGSHWLGVWTEDDTCEVMDSFGMDIARYNIPVVREVDARPFLDGTTKSQDFASHQ